MALTPNPDLDVPAPDAPAAVLRHLRWRVRGSWGVLVLERAARVFWPALAMSAGLSAAFLLGADRAMPGNWVLPIAAVAMLVLAVLFVGGALRFRLPGHADAVVRLDAMLPGRPLAALSDQQASGITDPASVALWQAHLARMSTRALAARVAAPDLRLARVDPYGLRLVALTALVVGLVFGAPRAIEELGAGPGTASGAVPPGPSWEGWVRPPEYTGRPVLYLNDIPDGPLDLAQGSAVVLRLYGNDGTLTIDETVSGTPLPTADDPSAPPQMAIDFAVQTAGQIAINGPGARRWQVALIPDAPPVIAPDGTMERAEQGRMELPFRASDDYGVAAGRAEVVLDLAAVDRRYGLAPTPQPRDPIVLDLPMPFSGDREALREILVEDLSQHPWANLPVMVRLTATDTLGQQATSQPLRGDLPGRRFFDPMAAAVIEARRDLLWTTENGARTLQVLRAITHQPDGFVRNEKAYLRLRVALHELDTALSPPRRSLDPQTRDALATALWEIAELIETGDLASALERLRRAQDRLDEAIRNGADPSEIDELMAELRAALDAYMRQLAQEAERAPEGQTSDLQGMQMSGNQLQEMLEQLQQLMEEGRMAEAGELMQMLRQLMENMQMAQGQGGPGQGSAEQQSLRDLGETLRDQQELSDDAFRSLQDGPEGQRGQLGEQGRQGEQGQQGQQGEQGQSPGPDGPRGPRDGAQGLADRQAELRRQLDELGRGALPGEGSEAGDRGREALDQAGRAMRNAERALRDDDLPGALDRQAEALEALREGLRDLGEAMAQDQERGQDQQGDAFGSADPNVARDPLGREPGQTGRIGTEDTMLGAEDTRKQAQDLLEELRKRSGEQSRPDAELDYLRRLLDRF